MIGRILWWFWIVPCVVIGMFILGIKVLFYGERAMTPNYGTMECDIKYYEGKRNGKNHAKTD